MFRFQKDLKQNEGDLTEALQKLPLIYCSFSTAALLTFGVGEFSVIRAVPCTVVYLAHRQPLPKWCQWLIPSHDSQNVSRYCQMSRCVEGGITLSGEPLTYRIKAQEGPSCCSLPPQLYPYIYTCTISTLLNAVLPRRPHPPAFLLLILASLACS